MDDHSQPEPECTHSSTCDVESPSHASGMFSHSQHFTVMGGTFTNVTNYTAAPSLPSDFRMIPMGDIDLRREIRVNKHTGSVACFQRYHVCVRRVHSAKARIDGRTKKVTVAMYQGNNVEEEWRQDIAKHMSLRHPNIVQICGAASSNGIHATLFNDDLIPLRDFLDGYRNSPVLTVYIYACCNSDFSAAYSYVNSEFQPTLNPGEFVVEDIYFRLHVSQTTEDALEGFLFSCPKEDFRMGSSSLCWPACTAYWSLDPSGIVRLSPEEATALGLPSFELATKAEGCSWDASVYEGLRQFHEAKGFDPYSQDVARDLGRPLYQLASQVDAPFIYVDSEEDAFDADIHSDFRSIYTEDYDIRENILW
ncbi:hypothetical protein MSAN_00126900 [Mycena sanguinolenta]|uniref:Protein kinase domain-containing protein n=1 Tax=Mycena sanguinolenta TaxID=230812 RepID=A0A8H7DLU2_9AGAR|nr:hypothetical protein MSAN_00126900 [Mycena sanguinolenta]